MADVNEKNELMIADKKAFVSWRLNHDLHVGLIMKKHGVNKTQALTQAYHEGVTGLNKRMGGN